jgi:hypothetical protein
MRHTWRLPWPFTSRPSSWRPPALNCGPIWDMSITTTAAMRSRYGSGLAWQGLERPDLARESFQAALELVPDCGPCREALQALAE